MRSWCWLYKAKNSSRALISQLTFLDACLEVCTDELLMVLDVANAHVHMGLPQICHGQSSIKNDIVFVISQYFQMLIHLSGYWQPLVCSKHLPINATKLYRRLRLAFAFQSSEIAHSCTCRK